MARFREQLVRLLAQPAMAAMAFKPTAVMTRLFQIWLVRFSRRTALVFCFRGPIRHRTLPI
jgi:hypothetical protein